MLVSSRTPRSTSNRLVEAGGGAGADAGAGAPAAPLGQEQLGQLRGGVGGYIKRGRVGHHAGSSRSWSVPQEEPILNRIASRLIQ
jgi:hypothetical protein